MQFSLVVFVGEKIREFNNSDEWMTKNQTQGIREKCTVTKIKSTLTLDFDVHNVLQELFTMGHIQLSDSQISLSVVSGTLLTAEFLR